MAKLMFFIDLKYLKDKAKPSSSWIPKLQNP
jgi:hypothetical protein